MEFSSINVETILLIKQCEKKLKKSAKTITTKEEISARKQFIDSVTQNVSATS